MLSINRSGFQVISKFQGRNFSKGVECNIPLNFQNVAVSENVADKRYYDGLII
jgi:hypothetical protein